MLPHAMSTAELEISTAIDGANHCLFPVYLIVMSLEKAATNGNQRLNETDSASNGSPMQLPTSAVPSLGLEISKIQRSIHSEQYIEAFTHSTTIVNELFDTAIRVIDLRAHISKKTSNNRQELEDALLLTKIDSQNYRSFLRAAKIYSIQGNQEDASKVLQKGIDVCLNKVHCGLLHQQLEVVQSQMNRRVDFVVQFPSEILCNILSHFDMAMVATCMDVCRLWRHKLLQCPVPWRIVDISTKNPSLPVVNRVLPTIAPHIRELHVFGAKFMDPWIGFFRQYNFSGLRTVRLDTGLFILRHLLIRSMFLNLDLFSNTRHICDIFPSTLSQMTFYQCLEVIVQEYKPLSQHR
ncbi:hypothetical protein BJV82DRAFT_653200 [Fennellomyces sp. T-0311]|nr:hypothetical protein BJV82DRAFT_653200 [Fennellomyces sp. T-0311]